MVLISLIFYYWHYLTGQMDHILATIRLMLAFEKKTDCSAVAVEASRVSFEAEKVWGSYC